MAQLGQSPDRGPSPNLNTHNLPAGRSPASHQAAKPVRRESKSLEAYFIPGGKAGAKRVKIFRGLLYTGRQSRCGIRSMLIRMTTMFHLDGDRLMLTYYCLVTTALADVGKTLTHSNGE